MAKNHKIMTATDAPTIRQIVKIANELKLQREDIVGIFPLREGYIMIYYYEGEEKQS